MNELKPAKLFIGNLPFSVDEAELRELFEEAGDVRRAKIVRSEDGESRGFGFVEMESGNEALKAIARFDGSQVNGRAINVSIARERARG